MPRVTKTESKTNATEVNSAKKAAFEEAIKIANKEIKSETGTLIAKLGDRPMNVETISTGSVVLDSILGGGFPRGRLIEIYGEESSGKTSIALTAVGNVQNEGGTAAFIDLENALDPRYARKLGVNTDDLALSQPDYAEQALQLVARLTASGAVDIIVVDSIASMIPRAELEGDMEQITIGLLARIMSKALKQLASMANKTGTTIVFINQTREAIGKFSPMGTPITTPGGKAMKFYASQRVEVKRLGQVKDGKDIIGNEVRLSVKKNKVAPPFGVSTTVLTFGRGINRAAEMIEVGPEYGVVGRPNNRTYIVAETGEIIATSKAEAVTALEQNEKLLEKLSAQLKEKINKGLFDEKNELTKEEVDVDEDDLLKENEEDILDGEVTLDEE